MKPHDPRDDGEGGRVGGESTDDGGDETTGESRVAFRLVRLLETVNGSAVLATHVGLQPGFDHVNWERDDPGHHAG